MCNFLKKKSFFDVAMIWVGIVFNNGKVIESATVCYKNANHLVVA